MNRIVGPLLFLLALPVFSAIGKTIVEWTFDKPGDLQGWQPNGHLKDIVVVNGKVRCRAAGRDPILQLQSPLEFEASPRQMVEIRLKADADGLAQLFWSNSSTGLYGGFTAAKTTDLRVCGDGSWRVYRLFPCWHPEGNIIRLRFDVYDAARFELDYIRILELGTPDFIVDADFDFTKSGHDWQWIETSTDRAPQMWRAGEVHCASTGLLLSPAIQLEADRKTVATLRLAVNRGTYATLYFITEAQPGLHSFTFPIIADGKDHIYDLDLLANANWAGRIVTLGLQPSEASNVTVKVRSLTFRDAVQVPARLAVRFFDAEDALPRAGVPCKVLAVVRNSGGRNASNLVAKLELPAGVKLLDDDPKEKTFARLGLGDEARFEWIALANRPMNAKLRLTLKAANAEMLNQARPIHFTMRQKTANKNYVPEPRPVRGPFEVGAYYFPGWPTADRWQWIQRFPERRPVLGWYREGDPEVADWQIKWAVEHGITFFAYDWYWTQGKRHLEHGLHDGYFNARYRQLLKFCLLWANHNPPGTSSHEDCIAVVRYWVQNYFHRPEYLTCDGKPVVIIYQPDRLTQDLGSADVKRALEAMREEYRRAGLKGLYITTCVGDAGIAKTAAIEGYDAITGYTWPGAGMTGAGMFAPFETLVPAYRRKWQDLLAESPLPQMPLLVCGGWDSRPWHGDDGLVRFGRTPGLFKQHLLDAKQFLETHSPKSDSPKMILIEAWNEWGEGSYIEPHKEFGFGYLDAIRAAFTDAPKVHAEGTPADTGLGPYDVSSAVTTNTAWNFNTDAEGWTASRLGAELKADGGYVSTPMGIPFFFSPMMQARADEFRAIVVRMKLTRANDVSFTDSARYSWVTSRMALGENRHMELPVYGDGQWHEYRIPVSPNPRWRGTITRLVLNPSRRADVTAELDFVHLIK